MINPYEIVSKSALPALRSMVAKRLREKYDLTQQQVADRLGVTQASVSNYARKARGVMVNLETDPTVAKAADMIAATLSGEKPDQMKALRIMTDVCDYVRFNHLMCTLHRELEPGFQVEGCEACDGAFSGKDFERLKIVVGQ
jgi:predicted transcriptional regulator